MTAFDEYKQFVASLNIWRKKGYDDGYHNKKTFPREYETLREPIGREYEEFRFFGIEDRLNKNPYNFEEYVKNRLTYN